MMEEDKKFLSDILQALELIDLFMQDTADYDDFQNDLKTRSAVERQLGIIGEAVNKYDNNYPDDSIKNARRIVGFRNRLIHAYDAVDSTIIWTIIKNHLPSLKEEIVLKLGPDRID